jgi:hypothetical protein
METPLKTTELVYVMRGAAKSHLAAFGSPLCGTRIRGRKVASDTTHTVDELRALTTCEKCLDGHRSAR